MKIRNTQTIHETTQTVTKLESFISVASGGFVDRMIFQHDAEAAISNSNQRRALKEMIKKELDARRKR